RAVTYSPQYPVVDFVKTAPGDDAIGRGFIEGLFRKSPEWQYEEEWRIVKFGGRAAGAYKYPPEALTALILGCEMKPPEVDEILRLLDSEGSRPKVFQAKANPRNYQLDLESIR
ncbi:MAG TPA: DUF2971 domain-containing protein, partial [Rhodothermales bacterium]